MSSPIQTIEGPEFGAGLGVGQDFVFVPDVSALRGANSIEALTTVGLNLSTLILVVIDGQFESWQLNSGDADGTDPTNDIQPFDYDSTTNNVHWHCTGKFKSGIAGIQVTRAAAQGIPSGVDTAIEFDTVRMNTGEWDETAPTRFACVTPGLYAVSGSVSFAANTSGQRRLYIKKNGSAYVSADVQSPQATSATVVKAATVIYLLTGDYLELFVNQTSGASLDAQKIADYSPEFSVAWLGNPIAQAIPTINAATTAPESEETGKTVTQSLNLTDAGWYRVYEGAIPAVGGFRLVRDGNADAGTVEIEAQFGVFGAPDTGAIQLIKNTQNGALQGIDSIRVSYEDTSAFVDIHLNLAGAWEITRPVKTGWVDAPFIVAAAGADGSVVLNISPNVIASTEPIDVPQLHSDGLQIAGPAVDGWISPTGTPTRTDFDPTTVTTEELAKRVTALILDHLSFGSIREGLPASMIYTDMLSLPNNLVDEGTSVNITDIFRITAAPDTSVQGTYVPVGTANGHTLYRLQGYEWNTANTYCVRFDGGTKWEIFGASGVLYRSSTPISPAEPWNTTQWQDTTPVNVAITTVAPNIAQIFNVLTDTHSAVYVDYHDDSTYSGVYRFVDTFNGKRRYYLYESGVADNKRVEWNAAGKWEIKGDAFGVLANSGEAVVYPDQVVSWSAPNPISVVRMDAIDLASGVVISGGSADTDGLYIPQLGVYSSGSPVYRRITDGTRFLNSTGNNWMITDTAGGFANIYATSDTFGKFPWEASWISFSLIAQEKNIAGPTNWHV